MDKSLYQTLLDAGVKVENRYSDLMFPMNEQTTAILSNFPEEKKISTTFLDNVSHTTWYEVPFAYTPYWEKRMQ